MGSVMETTLRFFSQEQVEQVAKYWRQADHNQPDLPAKISENLKFRDEKGEYWTYGLRGGRWYRFREGKWQKPRTKPNVLEGPVELASLLQHQEISDETGTVEIPEDLTSLVQGIKDKYQAGMFSSDQVEILLADLVVLGEDGAAWAVGFRSGTWYKFIGDQWVGQKEPFKPLPIPQDGMVTCSNCSKQVEADNQFCTHCGKELLDKAHSAAQTLWPQLEKIGFLPEAVAEPWEPPDSYPERLVCEFCGLNRLDKEVTCPNCKSSSPIDPNTPAVEAAPAPPPDPEAFGGQGTMMLAVCPNCGARVMPDQDFCGECGTAMQPARGEAVPSKPQTASQPQHVPASAPASTSNDSSQPSPRRPKWLLRGCLGLFGLCFLVSMCGGLIYLVQVFAAEGWYWY